MADTRGGLLFFGVTGHDTEHVGIDPAVSAREEGEDADRRLRIDQAVGLPGRAGWHCWRAAPRDSQPGGLRDGRSTSVAAPAVPPP